MHDVVPVQDWQELDGKKCIVTCIIARSKTIVRFIYLYVRPVRYLPLSGTWTTWIHLCIGQIVKIQLKMRENVKMHC